jgi:hypothetical protein
MIPGAAHTGGIVVSLLPFLFNDFKNLSKLHETSIQKENIKAISIFVSAGFST